MKKFWVLILASTSVGLFLAGTVCSAQTPMPGAKSRPTKTRDSVGLKAPAASSDYTFLTLDVLGANAASAEGISSPQNPEKIPSLVVGTFGDSNGSTGGFTYDIDTGKYGVVIGPDEPYSTYANGINNLNSIVGYYSPTQTSPRQGYILYGNGVTQTIDVPGAVETLPSAVSVDPLDPDQDAMIVGNYSDKTGTYHGFVYFEEDEHASTVDYPGGTSTDLRGIYCCTLNPNGPLIVGVFNAGSFLYSNVYNGGTFSTIAVPGGTQTYASGISGNLDIVGGYTDSSNILHGFVSYYTGGNFSNRRYVTVDVPGADQTFISAVSLDGTLVGSYGPNTTDTNAFIAFPNVFGQVEPSSLYFGGHTLGSKTELTLTLTNAGTSEEAGLDEIETTVGGTDKGDFTVVNNCAASTLNKGESCTIDVTFDPLVTGSRTASLTVREVNDSTGDPAVNSPQVISLAGVGSSEGTPAAQLTPASLKFGTLLVGTNVTKSVTLSNTGTGTLLISTIGLSGNYSQTNNCGKSVAAGKSCTISVKFAPTAGGTFDGLLSVYDDVSGGRQVVPITGAGTVVSLTPNPLEFGSTAVGSTSAPENITVENTGKTSLTISGDSITGDFQIAGGTCGKTLLAGASCTYSIEFKPTQKGTRTGTFSLKDNGGASPQNVSLSGTGT